MSTQNIPSLNNFRSVRFITGQTIVRLQQEIFPQVEWLGREGSKRFVEFYKEKLAGRFFSRLLLIALCLFLTAHISPLTAQVVSVSPAQNALNVSPNTTIQVTFAVPMMTTSELCFVRNVHYLISRNRDHKKAS